MKKNFSMLYLLIFLVSCSSENHKQSEKGESSNKLTTLQVNPKLFIPTLPAEVEESSGLILYNNLLWTFNDSGGENKIFGINFSGEIEREVVIENVTNTDWEDIAQDDEYFYVGDFGNNNGVRKDLKVYKILKSEINVEDTVEAEIMHFSYSEQDDFTFRRLNTPFDCEAITDFEGTLNIFTKDWVNEKTAVYQIPKTEGEYSLSFVDTFNVNGLVTGADISPDNKTLALVGYKDFKPIVWIFSDISESSFFNENELYMELDEIYSAQTEGICFKGNDTLLISCEGTTSFTQQVFLINLEEIEN